ncbi:MAG TPA: hypothetical protein VMT19_00455 [Thermoanaerobaculaceae bacterium]|nr:hypothetical protein [Thermoanaerobaculaceae bacterium]
MTPGGLLVLATIAAIVLVLALVRPRPLAGQVGGRVGPDPLPHREPGVATKRGERWNVGTASRTAPPGADASARRDSEGERKEEESDERQ